QQEGLSVCQTEEAFRRLDRRAVGPLDVVERHDHGTFLGQLREQRLEGRERSPGQRARGQLGDPGCRCVLRTEAHDGGEKRESLLRVLPEEVVEAAPEGYAEPE